MNPVLPLEIHVHSIQATYKDAATGFLTLRHIPTDTDLVRLSADRLREGVLLSKVSAMGVTFARPPFTIKTEGAIPTSVSMIFGLCSQKRGHTLFGGTCVLDDDGVIVDFKKHDGHFKIKGSGGESCEGFFQLKDSVTPTYLLEDIVATINAVPA
jgi:hypothetical protein